NRSVSARACGSFTRAESFVGTANLLGDSQGGLLVLQPNIARDLMARIVDCLSTSNRQLRPFVQVSFHSVNDLQSLQWHFVARSQSQPITEFTNSIHRQAVFGTLKDTSSFQQTGVEFMFLTARLSNAPATDALNRRPSPQRTTGLRQPPQRQQDPRVARMRNGGRAAHNLAVYDIFRNYWATDNVRFGSMAQKFHLTADLLRQKKIVGIEILQPGACRQFHQAIARRPSTSVRPRLPMDLTIKPAYNVETTVGGAIINDDDFLFPPGLGQRAFDRLPDPALGIETGDENGNQHPFGQCILGNGSIGSNVDENLGWPANLSEYWRRSINSVICHPSSAERRHGRFARIASASSAGPRQKSTNLSGLANWRLDDRTIGYLVQRCHSRVMPIATRKRLTRRSIAEVTREEGIARI